MNTIEFGAVKQMAATCAALKMLLGAGRDIGPDSALVFDVELLKVNN